MRLAMSRSSLSGSSCSRWRFPRSAFPRATSCPSFVFLYLASLVIFAIGQWTQANYYNLEPPLVALLLGLIDFQHRRPAALDGRGLPRRILCQDRHRSARRHASLLADRLGRPGRDLPGLAGVDRDVPRDLLHRAKLGLDRQLSATLGAGGAVCGVSASIAIAGAVGAKKEYAPIAITVVILWAIVMIFVLPLAARGLQLPTGVAGAWIGTSEFADAAGFAAAQTYGGFAGSVPGIAGTSDQAVWAFTLMKVVGRDVWIGVWALVLSIISTTRWEPAESGHKPQAIEIWRRFPKFVLGFLVASLIVTWASRGYSLAQFNKSVAPTLVAPFKDLRTWTFIFCFFSIGLTTRFAISRPREAGPSPPSAPAWS